MPPESSPELRAEIGHVLFLDIVGYSRLLIDQQSERLQQLKQVVRDTAQVQAATAEGALLRLPHRRRYGPGLSRQAGIRTGFGDEWVRVGAMKMTADGSISERTARLSQLTSAGLTTSESKS